MAGPPSPQPLNPVTFFFTVAKAKLPALLNSFYCFVYGSVGNISQFLFFLFCLAGENYRGGARPSYRCCELRKVSNFQLHRLGLNNNLLHNRFHKWYHSPNGYKEFITYKYTHPISPLCFPRLFSQPR